MINSKAAALVFLLMLALALFIPSNPAQASRPSAFSAIGWAYVSNGGNPEWLGGRSYRMATIGEEVRVDELTGGLQSSDWPGLNGASIVAQHISNVSVSLAGFSGTSHGTFEIHTLAGDHYQGFYESRISTTADCFVQDAGNWIINSGGVHARGTLNVCLNDWYGTLGGIATMSGQYN